MKRKIFLLLFAFTLLLSGLACSATVPQVEPTIFSSPVPQKTVIASTPTQGAFLLTESEVPRIAVDKAKEAFDSGKAIIVDVRSPDAYAASHVDGAINIPLASFETDMANVSLKKDQWIITYCT